MRNKKVYYCEFQIWNNLKCKSDFYQKWENQLEWTLLFRECKFAICMTPFKLLSRVFPTDKFLSVCLIYDINFKKTSNVCNTYIWCFFPWLFWWLWWLLWWLSWLLLWWLLWWLWWLLCLGVADSSMQEDAGCSSLLQGCFQAGSASDIFLFHDNPAAGLSATHLVIKDLKNWSFKFNPIKVSQGVKVKYKSFFCFGWKNFFL